ncbi:MAG: hypothetical protein ABIQ64_03710 [Candidatus Saccharimonadales bacterium]
MHSSIVEQDPLSRPLRLERDVQPRSSERQSVDTAHRALEGIKERNGLLAVDGVVAELVHDMNEGFIRGSVAEKDAEDTALVGLLEVAEGGIETIDELNAVSIEVIEKPMREILTAEGEDTIENIVAALEKHHPVQPEPYETKGVWDSVAAEMESRSLEASANFMGNWMNLQQDRMKSEAFKHKLEHWMNLDAQTAQPSFGDVYRYAKPDEIKSRIADYDLNVEKVYSSVQHVEASVQHKAPTDLGTSPNYAQTGVVFSDAVKDGQTLSGRQKDIIAAHEAHHGIVLASYGFREAVNKGVDITQPFGEEGNRDRMPSKYRQSGHEVLARMAQLKNYFGMDGDQQFSKAHLDYARSHYVVDTGLDNSMSELFKLITPDTEPTFIDNMNSMPV